jgi:predicted enzyme related to lactoylglutathione lyase
MSLISMDLAWIVVNDLKKAIEFYTKTVGLKLMEHNEEYGWAEFQGPKGGARLGVAQLSPDPMDDVKPGDNAVLAFTVSDLNKAASEMVKKGAQLVGAVQDIPGHVKLQMVKDVDGNRFQLVQMYEHHCEHC